MTHDLIILGGGPAGYHAAERAAHAGLKVLLCEQNKIGGVCLNEGCIPAKTLLYSAKIADLAKVGGTYGVTTDRVSCDLEKIITRKNKVVKILVAGVSSSLKKHNVTIVDGSAQLTGKRGEEYLVEVAGQTFGARYIIIATGAQSVIPPIPGLQESIANGRAGTSKEALEWNTVPESLVVIGAGVVGLELASFWNSMGSNVTLIDILPQIGGMIDHSIAALLEKNYRSKGVNFKLQTRVIKIENGNVTCSNGSNEETVRADRILVSAGRKPVISELGLENLGVTCDKNHISTDAQGQTNIPGVFACGDVNGRSMLAHTAYREAEVCVNTMLSRADALDYRIIPSVIYTNPEVASVGETESSAREKGLEFDQAEISMRYSGRYLAENEGGDGICKILAEKKTNRLIGVHVIANGGSEMIYGAGLMIAREMTITEIRDTVFPHPSVAEIIKEAANQL